MQRKSSPKDVQQVEPIVELHAGRGHGAQQKKSFPQKLWIS
jgi:hypothetical protein